MKNFGVHLCLDKGNTRVKAGIFKNNNLLLMQVYDVFGAYELETLRNRFLPTSCILCNVGEPDDALIRLLNTTFEQFILFDNTTILPIIIKYKTPETLGKDRIAAVVGAQWLKPNTNLLVVDAGTAITYDLIDASGIYHGGNIAAGLEMRLKALHAFTKRLPLVQPNAEVDFMGNNTVNALSAGALYGIQFEINGYFDTLKIKYPELSLFLTGGDLNYFASKLKSPIFAEKNLVLIGLSRIIQCNVV